jgi:hypothetical protein
MAPVDATIIRTLDEGDSAELDVRLPARPAKAFDGIRPI